MKRFWIGLLVWTLAVPAIADVGFYEAEPNNTPVDANPVSGEVTIYGSMVEGDQDGFLWTVSDDDSRRLWTFELHGIPGALTIAEVAEVEYTEDGSAVNAVERLMKMGTRDGLTPSIHANQIFEPGTYLIGIAYAGGPKEGGGGSFRPPAASLDFGIEGKPESEDGTATEAASEQPGAYRFLISANAPLHLQPSPGPSETREAARNITPGREFATFESSATTWYRFDFDEDRAKQRWNIDVRAPLGRDLSVRLTDSEGNTLSNDSADPHGHVRFTDLAPDAGTTWYVEITTKDPGFAHRIDSEAVGIRVLGEEAEPNDQKALANRVDFARPVTGRIGDDDRSDYFSFDVTESDSDRLHALTVATTPPTQLQLCLMQADGSYVQCRDGDSPVSLPDLQLPPGEWGLLVSRARQAAEYSLSYTAEGAVEPGMEVEPNDSIEYASGVPANFRIKGRFHGDDKDFFAFLVPDEPQLWRFQVVGDEIFELGYYDGSGHQRTSIRAAGGQRRVTLDSVFLLPGKHYVRVQGRDGGKYTLLARALGPPDPDGELEPNDPSNMQRLAFGQTRNGLLAERADTDYYRFFLASWDHIRLTIQPPSDGTINPFLYWYGSALGDGQPGGPGEPVVVEGLFPPGDYHIRLTPNQVSDAEYTVRLERLPRFSCPSDCEPNGMRQVWLAAPLPPDLVLEGKSGDWRDRDYYQLPAFDEPTELVIHTTEPVREINLGTRWGERERLIHDPDLGGYRTTVPAGEPYRLMLDSGKKPYRLELEFPDGPIRAVSEPLPAALKIDLRADQVAAYRIHGQRLAGTLALTNEGPAPLQVSLQAATSDYRWQVELDDDSLAVRPGASASVPLQVLVPADAWADRSVRISAVARDASGRQVETWRDIAVGRDTEPVNPVLSWPIPEALRGGFNAAWSSLGATWTEDTKLGSQNQVVRDETVFDGQRMEFGGDNDGWSDDEKPLLTIDLPGDDALPVAGMAINHFGTPGVYVDIRRGTLLLSMDGVSFEEVLHFEALPVQTEQQFALPEPRLARFARLRIDSTFHEPSSDRVFVSEWKVILEPGFDLSGGRGFDIANPDLGGHVVSDDPPEPYSPTSVLEDVTKAERAGTRGEPTKDYVIGFFQDRAAQITRLEWLYPDDLEERWKGFDRVDVSASLESPIGPWLPLGAIDLSGAKTTGTLELSEPTWARFVRFAAQLHADTVSANEPGLLRIWERPTGEDYTSVLTEWGDNGSRAYYELSAGVLPEAAVTASDNTSRATAAPLSVGALARGEVSLGRKIEHWYRLAVPAGENTLSLDLTGDPTVRTVLSMEDAQGNAIPLRRIEREVTPRLHTFEAVVEPGAEVYLRVAEPPRNVVFSWDTSASVNAYIPLINNSLVAFSGEVVPGQEAVNLMPFSMSPLLEEWYGEPYVLQTILNDYRRGPSSSSAEQTLKGAAVELAPRAGTKAVVVITDGETVHDGGMWNEMRKAQPRIFAVQVAGSKMWHQNVMRDWSRINGGHFTQLLYEGEMEVAFDRASALMHRPAGYTLRARSEFREAPGPGSLSVTAGEGSSGAGNAAVELILDASGSMLQRMQGKRRIAIAKEVLTEAVRQHIPAGTPVALRVFGHKEVDSCRTDLEIPLAPLDPAAAAAAIAGVNAMNLARTPIADSLAAVQSDLQGANSGVVVLVTDGEETCNGDPAAVIDGLKASGFQVSVNIVGFAIDDVDLAAQFESWAERGGGRYFAANDQGGLSDAIESALHIPFTVFDQGGNEVATGEVGGEPVELEQGFYRVVVNTAPPRTFEKVEVQGEKAVALELE